MRIFSTFLFQLLFFSGASGSAFLFSNIIYPIQSALDRAPLQMPSMKLNFSEFSPAFAAFEDEYYISMYKEEEIPQKIKATELKTPDNEIIKSEAVELNIPQMTMRPTENINNIMNISGVKLVSQTERQEGEQKPITAEDLLRAQKNNPVLVTPVLSHYWIQGKIELTEGLAISDPRDKLSVGWFVDGERKKEGKVFHQDGTYELKVERLEGEMIAELTDRRGFLLGEAIIDLDVIKKQRAINSYVISGIDLKIKPYNFSFRGQTLSVYDTSNNKQVVAGAEVRVGAHDLRVKSDKKGEFSEPVLSPQSTGVVTAQQAKYRETTLLAHFDRELSIHLFPDQFLEAFFNTIELPQKMRTDGVIWGTVTKGSQPAQGYQVRMAQQKAKPIYFEMYIANVKTEKTGIDGQFAFVGLADGEYEIEVVDPLGRLVDSKLAVVRASTVTEMNFEVVDDRKIAVRPFDPLSLQPKDIEFFALGQNTIVETKTEETIKLITFPGAEPLIIHTKVDGADVEAISLASRNKKFQEVPVLNTNWWQGIKSAYSLSPQIGVVVGFIDTDSTFEVYIDHQNERTKVLYLDSKGRTINKSLGVKPSGFVIYGVDHGIHTIIIETEHGQIHSEAAYIDGESVSLIYKAL